MLKLVFVRSSALEPENAVADTNFLETKIHKRNVMKHT